MKKFLSLVLALVMTMSLVTVSAGAKDFTDSSKITYDEAVAVMSAAKVIDGYAEGDFRPTNTLTRGAAAKIICNLILGPTTASALVADAAPYKDVPTNHTFAGYIAYCQKEGIISGYADGTFKPGNTLTGYAFMKMLLGALGYDSAIEGYTGANWSIAVAKQAINAGLNNSLKGSFNGVKAVTREEACLYAFNTLKATMVEYDNRIVVGEGSSAVAISGVRKDLTWNKGTLNDGKIKKDGYVQFGEQYFEKLTRTDDTDDFGRPASKWTYDKKDIGTYVNYDLLVSEYTTKVKGGDVYSDIGSVAADYDLTYYVDGVKLEKDAVKTQSSYIAKKNDDKMGDSGNGVLTQIFVDNDDEALTIVEINTYLAKTDDYNEKKETLKFNEIYGYGDVKLTKKLVKAVEAVELDDIASIKDYKDGDMVLLTIANGEVKTITPAETVKGTEIDEFSKQDYVNAGQKYSYAATGKLDGSFGIDELNNYDNKNLDDKTFDLYLDQYGYLIGIEQVEDDVEYVFITSYEITSKYMTNRTAKATAIFEDGTTKDIEVNLKKSDDDVVKDWTNRKDGKTNENRWYEYTVKNDSYELTLAATQIHDTDTDKIDSKHVSQKGVKNDGVTVDKNYYYGNADTNYITVSVDDVNGKVAVDKVESVVKGVKNVSINVWDEAKAKTEAELPNATDVTYGIYTVYEKNKAYARASIVVGDDGSVSDRYAYLYDEPNYERYNKSEDVYYWEMDAVIDGVKTTVTFKSDLPFKDTVLDTMKVEGGMFKLSYDKDGYAVDVDKLKEGIDNDYILLSDYMDQKPDDLNIITNKGEFTSEKVQVEKDTLWITDQTAKRGFALADKCPAVIVELNKDSKGNWEIDDTVEYTTVEKAVRSMETYDTKDKFATFEGEIYLMFKDGIVSSVVLIDKVAKDGHIKDNTTGKITEAAISKDASGKLVATWTDNKAYAGSKYVVDFYLVDGAKEYLKDTVTDISANNDTHSEVSSKIAQNGDYYAVIRILDKDGKVVASATTAVKGFAF